MNRPSSRSPKAPVGMQGNLALTRVRDVLHYLAATGGSGELEVTKMPEEIVARLRLVSGKLVQASTRNRTGPAVVDEVERWTKGMYAFRQLRADAPAPSSNEPAALPGQPPAEPRRDASTVMSKLAGVPGVRGVLVIGRDGFVLEKAGVFQASPDDLGAWLAESAATMESIGGALQAQAVRDVIMVYGAAIVLCKPLGESWMTMVIDDATRLGAVRQQTRELMTELATWF